MISNKAKGMSSKEHIRHSYNTGEQGEALFAKVMEARGIEFRSANESDNKKRHVDFWVGPKYAQVGVDVKGLKASHKKGYVVVEGKNVQGKDGWCAPSTAAGLIAFQFEDCFIVVPKDLLWDYVEPFLFGENAETYEGKFDVKGVHHKKYTRAGRNDLMTIISREELESMQHIKYNFDGGIIDKKGRVTYVDPPNQPNPASENPPNSWDLDIS